MGTITRADLYPFAAGTPAGLPTQTQAASGKVVDEAPLAPAMSWVGMVVILVALRILYEFAPVGD